MMTNPLTDYLEIMDYLFWVVYESGFLDKEGRHLQFFHY